MTNRFAAPKLSLLLSHAATLFRLVAQNENNHNISPTVLNLSRLLNTKIKQLTRYQIPRYNNRERHGAIQNQIKENRVKLSLMEGIPG